VERPWVAAPRQQDDGRCGTNQCRTLRQPDLRGFAPLFFSNSPQLGFPSSSCEQSMTGGAALLDDGASTMMLWPATPVLLDRTLPTKPPVCAASLSDVPVRMSNA